MPANAQLLAEIDRLTKHWQNAHLFQVENARRVNNIIIEYTSTCLPRMAGSSVEKLASGPFLHRSSTTTSKEHTWGIFCEHVLQHFEPSKYQTGLREKLQRLKQTADIESYNSEYSALVFRVEGMSKYEIIHRIDDEHDRKERQETKKLNNLAVGKGRFEPMTDSNRMEGRTCYFYEKLEHVKDNCFLWKKDHEKQGRDQPHRLSSRPSDVGSLSPCPTWEVG
ncbi:Hypothetical protein PHPALM_4428 [Phytophthora palmivora]|uniref:Retrotransposon gag domain-containing protein n=1 Tax=Phytophthora palmivora TaxID=4796 RepID=A0A2P4YJV9_9STRA|nr:Hypothetical protein PHPALM_4428 [Phytophthora palmivora]